MKKLFLSLVVVMMSTMSFAQGSLLATLSHEGNISAYYGIDALKQAVSAAEAGDVITLSSGQFNAVNITKPVTLRGAGMSMSTDSINPHGLTQIQNAFSINIADSLSGRLILEGLYIKESILYSGNIKNAQFMKCRFYRFVRNSANSQLSNATFVNCRIYDGFNMGQNSSAYFVNSAVGSPMNEESSSNAEFDNCFVKFDYNSSYGCFLSSFSNGEFKNCIIQHAYTSGYSASYYTLPASCTAYNCVGLGYSSYNMFANMTSNNKTNRFYSNSSSALSSLFKNYTAAGYATNVSDTYDFTLTDNAAKTYLRLDGTQVGIYGGNLPYNETPAIPQITKCNVAAKSTADGKLSVDIEVKAAEY